MILNVSHGDVLYAPHKTPEIRLPEVRMVRGGETTPIIRNYRPTDYLIELLEAG